MRIRPLWQVISVVVLAFVAIVCGHDRTFTGPHLPEQLHIDPITWPGIDFSRCEPNQYDENGITPLFAAVFAAKHRAVEDLLRRGADPKKRVYRTGGYRMKFSIGGKSYEYFDVCGWTPLHLAAFCGDREIIRILLEAGAEVDVRSEAGQTPLMAAVLHNRDIYLFGDENRHISPEEIIDWFVELAADVDTVDHYGNTAIKLAEKHKWGDVAKHLRKVKIAPEYRDAAMAGNYEVVKRFLDNGEKINRKICWKGTALHYAVDNQNEALVELLLDRGAALNIKNDHGQTPLALAREIKNDAIIRRLTAAIEKTDKRIALNLGPGSSPPNQPTPLTTHSNRIRGNQSLHSRPRSRENTGISAGMTS